MGGRGVFEECSGLLYSTTQYIEEWDVGCGWRQEYEEYIVLKYGRKAIQTRVDWSTVQPSKKYSWSADMAEIGSTVVEEKRTATGTSSQLE